MLLIEIFSHLNFNLNSHIRRQTQKRERKTMEKNTTRQHKDNDPLFIREAVVEELLSWSECVEAMESALVAATKNSKTADEPFSSQTLRTFTPAEKRGVLLTMPGFVGNYTIDSVTGDTRHSTLACKLVTSFAGNSQLNPPLPSILATILLFDESSGRVRAILEGTEITAWRTASVSLAATKHLYSGLNNRAKTLAICGCGTQVSFSLIHSLIDFNDTTIAQFVKINNKKFRT